LTLRHLKSTTSVALPRLASWFCIAWTTPIAALAGPVQEPPQLAAVDLYGHYCSGCHGPELQGGQGPSLIAGTYIHGTKDESVARSINEGYADKGMPSWSGTLTDEDIRRLVAYIRLNRTENTPEHLAQMDVATKRAILSRHFASELHNFHLEIVADTGMPFGLAPLPDGRLLLTEIAGNLRIIQKGRLLREPVKGTPAGHPTDLFHRVLLDVAAHPDYEHNGWIYLVCADTGPGADGKPSIFESIVRGHLRNNEWIDSQMLVRIPVPNTATGRLALDGHGYMYLTTSVEPGISEALGGKPFASADLLNMPPQDLKDPLARGKILRFRDDGSVPADNPFVKSTGALPSIWSYGHRNPQGLAVDPTTGWLWSTEHGPRGGDELNLIKRGHNYGFPVISYGSSYNGIAFTADITREGMDQPVINWTPSIAVSHIAFYEGEAFPKWKHDLFIGSLKYQELFRVVLSGERAVVQESILKGVGRIRALASDRSGLLYLAIELKMQGLVVRLVPDK